MPGRPHNVSTRDKLAKHARHLVEPPEEFVNAKLKIIDVVSHTKRVTPESIDELKELVGVPNRAFRQGVERRPVLHDVATPRLARLPEKVSIARLRDDKRATFFEASHNVLHGPTSAR